MITTSILPNPSHIAPHTLHEMGIYPFYTLPFNQGSKFSPAAVFGFKGRCWANINGDILEFGMPQGSGLCYAGKELTRFWDQHSLVIKAENGFANTRGVA